MATLFNLRQADRHVHHGYTLELVRKFRQTGFVINKKKNTEKPMRYKVNEVVVLVQVTTLFSDVN